MAILGKPCLAIVTLATASERGGKHDLTITTVYTYVPPILLPHAKSVIPRIPSDILTNTPNTYTRTPMSICVITYLVPVIH